MTFSKVNVNKKYFSRTQMGGIEVSNVIGYVVGVSSAISRQDTPYYKLFIKTIEGVTYPCMIFDLLKPLQAGLPILSLKKHFIQFSGHVSGAPFNSIVIDPSSVILLNHSDVADAASFIGLTSNMDEMYSEINSVFTKYNLAPLSNVYRSSSYGCVRNGVVGAFVELIDLWLCQILNFTRAYPSEDEKTILTCFYNVITLYSRYLDRIDILDFFTGSDKLKILEIANNIKDEFIRRVTVDALNAIILVNNEKCSPEHLFSHIIVNSFRCVTQTLEASIKWETLPEGGVTYLQCGEILKRS